MFFTHSLCLPLTGFNNFFIKILKQTFKDIATMSFFEKLKNLSGGPPAPPRRTENNAAWPADEFNDEEGDTYEAPPCERPALNIRQRPVEENVYLERTSIPVRPQRQAAPPPIPGDPLKRQQHAEDFFNDPNTNKSPAIDRNEKPGRKKMMPPTTICPPDPPTGSNSEEDVYLDPNEEQEDNDEVYLEPTDACTPASREPMRMPPSSQAGLALSSVPVVKPPVPRAKSNSVVLSINEAKTAPLEMRHATFPPKLPPPAPSVKPPLPANIKEAKARLESPPHPLMTDSKTVVLSGGLRTTIQSKQSGYEGKDWFAGDCNRKTSEELLLRVNKDGAFLIRHSSAQSPQQPYTLAVLHQKKVYNIPIRFLEVTRGYALGKEGKKNEEIFSSLDDMIFHHSHHRLLLIDSRSQAKNTTYLTYPARP